MQMMESVNKDINAGTINTLEDLQEQIITRGYRFVISAVKWKLQQKNRTEKSRTDKCNA